MSFDDEAEERTERTLFSVHFRANTLECRTLFLRVYALPQFREHSVLQGLINRGRFSTFDPRAHAMVEKCEALYAELQRATADLVAEMEVQR